MTRTAHAYTTPAAPPLLPSASVRQINRMTDELRIVRAARSALDADRHPLSAMAGDTLIAELSQRIASAQRHALVMGGCNG